MFAGLTAFIADHRAWAGPIVGLVVFAETLAVVGLFFPATPIMFAIGGMMGAGSLNSPAILTWAVVGAVIGDGISYGLGRHIGPSIYYRPPFNRHRSMFAKARLFFRRYGFVAIFVGRFLGPVRTTVPLVAGVANMKARTFQIANILSACVWVPASFAPGYIALTGIGFAHIVDPADLIAFGGVIAVLSIVVTILGSVIVARGRAKRRAR